MFTPPIPFAARREAAEATYVSEHRWRLAVIFAVLLGVAALGANAPASRLPGALAAVAVIALYTGRRVALHYRLHAQSWDAMQAAVFANQRALPIAPERRAAFEAFLGAHPEIGGSWRSAFASLEATRAAGEIDAADYRRLCNTLYRAWSTTYYEERMQRDRPAARSIMGSLFGLLAVAAGGVLIAVAEALRGWSLALAVLTSIWLLVAGVGLMRHRRWAVVHVAVALVLLELFLTAAVLLRPPGVLAMPAWPLAVVPIYAGLFWANRKLFQTDLDAAAT